MDPSLRSAALSAVHRVRAAWATAPGDEPPAPAALLNALSEAPPPARIEAVIADAEERWDRRLPATLEHYQALLPGAATDPELRRALLMCEVTRRAHEPEASLRADLLARHPDLGADIDAVLALAAMMSGAAAPAPAREPTPGDRLGKYTLIRRLGAGAFGEVWQARDEALNRYVALKLLFAPPRPGPEAGGDRLIAEARAAAALDHEHIVAVHDAGALPDPDAPADPARARLYIDSQLVADPAPTPEDPINVAVGRSLEAGLDPALAPPARARSAAGIVSAIARAVAAAHARGILHRDLKPANILLTPSGRPMVADFGLSVSGPLPGAAPAGGDGEGFIVGTPAYMAPEQARGERATPLTDVFALGAILRYLLTGLAPYSPSGRFSPDARADVLAQARAAGVAPLRRTHPRLDRTLALIADKAMAPDPAARYISAEQLAADLDAYRSHRPTLADRPSPARAARLWYRRHLPAATVAVAALLVIGAGTVRFILEVEAERDRARQAEADALRRRDEAERARDTAAATLRILQDMLASVQPGASSARDPRVSDVLTAAARRADDMADQPLVEAAVRFTIGQTYLTLSRPADAAPHLERSLALRREHLGAAHAETIQSRRAYASLLHLRGRTREAVAELSATAEDAAATLGPAARETCAILNTLGTLYEQVGEYDAAEDCQRRALEGRRATLGEDHLETLGSRRALANLLARWPGHRAESMAELRSVIEALKAHPKAGGAGFFAALTAQDLGAMLRMDGRPDEARPILEDALARLRAAAGPEHQNTLTAEANLAALHLRDRRDPASALPLIRHAADASVRLFSPGHVASIEFRRLLGECHAAMGHTEEARAALTGALESARKSLGEDHPQTRDLDTLLRKLPPPP